MSLLVERRSVRGSEGLYIDMSRKVEKRKNSFLFVIKKRNVKMNRRTEVRKNDGNPET